MNCPNCKNPIQENATECEWCGIAVNFNNNKTIFNSLNAIENQNPIKPNVKKNINHLIPGIVIIIIWILGNLISERDKHAIFGMDDLSPILFLGLIVLGIGLLMKFIKK